MSDLTPDQAIDQLRNLPEDQQRTVLGKLSPDVLANVKNRLKTYGLTENPRGEGVYKMAIKGSNAIPIPYSRIADAASAGFVMDPSDIKTYVRDASVDPQLNEKTGLPNGVKYIGRNSAGQPILAGEEGPEGSGTHRFLAAAGQVLGGAASGLWHGVTDKPQGAGDWAAASIGGPAGLFLKRFIVAPQVEQGKEAIESYKKGDLSQAVGHAIAAAVPGYGPPAAQAGEAIGEVIGTGDYAGAAGTAVGNAGLLAVPEIVKGVVKVAKAPAESALRGWTGTGPRAVKQVAKEALKANEEAVESAKKQDVTNTQNHLKDVLDALDKTRQAEDLYQQSEKTAREEHEAKEEKTREEFNKAELERIKDEGDSRLEALENNRKTIQDYEKKKKETREGNNAERRREITRQNLESEERSASKRLDDKYQKAKETARNNYNSAWNKWRDKVKTLDVNPSTVVQTIKDQEKSMNPQQQAIFKDILRSTKPDTADLNDYDLTRQEIIKGQGLGNANYDDLPPERKITVDKIMDSLDMDDVASSATDGSIKEIPATRLHGWKSQLERAVRSTSDGTVKYAIGKVLDSTRNLEESASRSVGADKELFAARALTGPYFDAFFGVRDELGKAATQSLREQTQDYVKQKMQEERLERIAAYDPSISSLATHLANIKEAIANIPKLKGYTEVPVGPEVGEVPAKPAPIQAYEGTPYKPQPEPNREAPPDKPAPVPPETKEATLEDVTKKKQKNLDESLHSLRTAALKRSLYAGLTGVAFGLLSAFRPTASIAADVASGIAASTIVGVVPTWMANLIEKPSITNWLIHTPEKDIKVINSLPPEERSVFVNDLRQVVKAADAKKIKVSPYLRTLIASSGSEQKQKSLQEIKKEAEERNPSQPMNQNLPEGVTHYFDEGSGTILPLARSLVSK